MLRNQPALRSRFLLLLAFVAALPCCAQSVLTMTASRIGNGGGKALAQGEIWFSPQLYGKPYGFKIGGGGQATVDPVKCHVVGGAITGSFDGGLCTLADLTQTTPSFGCFNTTIVNSATNTKVQSPGLSCVQPSSAAYWCSNGVCNLDNYLQPGTPGTPVTTGPTGATGATGTAAVVTSNGVNGGFAVPGILSDGAGSAPALPGDPTQALQAAPKQYVDATRGGIWLRQGPVVYGGANEQFAAQEPTLIHEGNPIILPQFESVFKLWWTCGWTNEGLCYAESPDGKNWAHYSGNPVIPNNSNPGISHGFVLHYGGVYHYYASNQCCTDSSAYNDWVSNDGVTNWHVLHANIITRGPAGSWDTGAMGNVYVIPNAYGSTWYMLYESSLAPGGPIQPNIFIDGVATSNDGGATWQKYSGNPVITGPTGGDCGGPEVHSTLR